VAISGDYAVVGADQENNNMGSAYVFKRSGTSWTQEAKLMTKSALPSNPGQNMVTKRSLISRNCWY